MINIRTLVLGAYQTNCYLVWADGSDTCAVIDPGYMPDRVLDAVRSEGKTVEAILLTHGHFDHVGAVKDIAAETDCRVYLHPQELSLPGVMTAGTLYYTHTYEEGDRICAAGLSFRVLHTPGHTPGSVCLQAENVLLSGDTLFCGSCGRTDFPGSSPADMRRSLNRLAAIPEDLRVFPGHAEDTTLSQEKQYNPFLRG